MFHKNFKNKTKMKKIKLVLASVAIAVALVSCGGKKEGGSESAAGGNSLDGTWEIVKAEGTMAEMNKGTQYKFEGDKMTLGTGLLQSKGTYKLAGDSIIFTIEGGMVMKYTHSMVNNQLVVKVVGSDQVFYMDKK